MSSDGLIELEDRDGTVRHFRPAAFVPMDEETYLVLIEDKLNLFGEENIIFARLQDDGDETSFEVVEDRALSRRVYRKYCEAMEK